MVIMYHEVWVSDDSEPLLIFVGLWLCGAPIADFLDKIRRIASLAEAAQGAGDTGVEVTEGKPPDKNLP